MINTMIETYDGSVAEKKNCRFIKGEFYIKNKQCFMINGTWYRVNSGFIAFDHEMDKWVVIKDTPALIKGIVSYDHVKKEVVLGYFTTNPYNNVNVVLGNGSSYTCINHRILPDSFVEDILNMRFVHKSMSVSSRIPNITFNNNGYPYQLPYCTKHYPADIYKLFVDKVRAHKNKTNISNHINAIGDYSFGFEFETSRGKIPNYKILETGLLPLRDGSISGIEYATVPLKGIAGVSMLEKACENLQRYTTFSENESLHLHLGNVPTSKEFIGYLYTLTCILEKEIYDIFPRYYAQTSKFKARQKDYNMPLKKELVANNPKETFDNIAFYLSEGKKFQGFGAEHPNDPEGAHKWNINARYHWVNFIPLLFGSNKTLEFRCHIPTRDPIKVINWLYICSAIIRFAERMFNMGRDLKDLKTVTLAEVLRTVYTPSLSPYLINYVETRKRNRIADDAAGDYIGLTEISSELSNKSLYKDI